MKLNKQIRKLKAMSPLQKVIIAFFVVSFCIVTFNSIYNMINQKLIQTMTVGAEVTDVVYSDYGFITVEESLITVKSSGTAELIVKEGERAPKNSELFSITSEGDDGEEKTKPYYAPISGIVSYHIDGYENEADIEKIKDLNFRSIYEENFTSGNKTAAKSEAVAGEVYAKVIDNLKETDLYMSCSADGDYAFIAQDATLRVRFPELNESTQGTVKEVINQDDGKVFCKIALGSVSEVALTNRVVQAELYQAQTSTLDLPKETLVYNSDGDAGVYIVSGGTVIWQAVNVINESDSRVECETLPEGTVIVLNPKRVELGDNVKGS